MVSQVADALQSVELKPNYHCQPESPQRPDIVSNAKARTPLITDEKFPSMSNIIKVITRGFADQWLLDLQK